MNDAPVPVGYELRAPTRADLPAVAEVFTAYEMSDLGRQDFDAAFLREDWERPRFDPTKDAWIVTSPDGRIVGYGSVYEEESHLILDSSLCIHPSEIGLGLDETLLARIEVRAREQISFAPAGRPVRLQQPVLSTDEIHASLLARSGFAPVRHYRHMETALDEDISPGPPPAGIEIRRFVAGVDDRSLYEAIEESFRGEWGFTSIPFDDWSDRFVRGPEFDPDLWLLAVENDEIAGFVIGKTWGGTRAWIDLVGVRSRWRRRSLGACLLRSAFAVFAARGFPDVTLNVDSENETGAVSLYERVGMRIRRAWDLFEKELT